MTEAVAVWRELLITNTVTSGIQKDPVIVALNQGRFAVIWSDSGAAFGAPRIVGQIFDPAGNPAGAQFELSDLSDPSWGATQHSATVLADGTLAVAYKFDKGGGDTGIHVVKYSAQGVRIGNAVTIEDDNTAGYPVIEGLGDGTYAVGFERFLAAANGVPDAQTAYAKFFAADGTELHETKYVPGRVTELERLQDNRLLVGVEWNFDTDPDFEMGQVYLETATAALPYAAALGVAPYPFNQFLHLDMSFGQQSDGDIIGTWTLTTSAGEDVYFRFYSETLVNQSNFSPIGEHPNDETRPELLILPDDTFLLIWYDTNLGAHVGRHYLSNGSNWVDFTLNAAPSNSRFAVESLNDGRFVLSWTVGEPNWNVATAILDTRSAALFGTEDAEVLTSPAQLPLVYAAGGDDVVFGGQASDVLYGGTGNDTLDGGAGNDVLDGGAGGDVMSGGPGNDYYYVDSLSDIVVDSSGFDIIYSTILLAPVAGIEQVVLIGSSPLRLTGDSGANTLTGNDGNNVLIGGRGKDTLTGGLGADDFVFKSIKDTGKTAGSRDVITDFRPRIDDIDLRAIDANTTKGGNQAFKFIGKEPFHKVAGELRYEKINRSGTDRDITLVSGDVTGDGRADFQIELKGLVNLTKGDFIL